MIANIVKICEIELSPDELSQLSAARDILEKIVDTASLWNVAGFKVANEYEDYYLDEFSNCVIMLNDLCHPSGRLTGYFQEYSELNGAARLGKLDQAI